MAGWDDYDDKQLKALVNRLNLAVETRHERKTFFQTQQGPLQEERFNWYKIFVMLDLDGSGRWATRSCWDAFGAAIPV